MLPMDCMGLVTLHTSVKKTSSEPSAMDSWMAIQPTVRTQTRINRLEKDVVINEMT
ncbi:hypothetical protein D3C73_1353710 [compost metagenome]